MKLIKFKNGISPMKAVIITRNNRQHFNINHGTRSVDGWSASFGVDDNVVSSELGEKEYTVEMIHDDYILVPIYDHGTKDHKLDKLGNKKYFVSRNQSEDDSSVLIFLTLPKISDVSYKIFGMGRPISKGIDVSYSDKEQLLTEAPIILLEDASMISITYTLDGNKKEEKIIFKNKKLEHTKD